MGLTGDTGHSFGAHLHFELLRGEATFDPMPWLQEHAGTHFTDSESDTEDDDLDFASEDFRSDTQSSGSISGIIRPGDKLFWLRRRRNTPR